jgi:hypothetical protein
MAPNDPDANFCTECGAPLTSYASTGPFEHLFAEGAVYRQAAERPRNLVVVVGVWLIFGMLASGGLLFLVLASGGLPFLVLGRDFSVLVAMVGAGSFAVSVAMIWRTTRSYATRKQVKANHDG